MAIHRGIQSAVFYYLSCAPCAEARYRKKRKQEATRGRAERDALEAEIPNLYRHPSPSSTNPHWQAEISAGPTLVSRGKRKNTSDSRRALKTSTTQSSTDSRLPSSIDLANGSPDEKGGKWDFRRYQREDEELWGSVSSERLAYSTFDGITRPPRARTRGGYATEDGGSAYRNPAVSDLHPAVVTRVHNREEAKWMLQPPPVAEVMSGKERGVRSRSGSGASSRLSACSGAPLSRGASQRNLEQQLKSRENLQLPTVPEPGATRHSNSSSTRIPDDEPIEAKDFATTRPPPTQKRRPPAIRLHSDSSATTTIHNPPQAPRGLQARRVASKPRLSTIVSDNHISTTSDDFLPSPAHPKENRSPGEDDNDGAVSTQPHRRSAPLLLQDPALKTIRDLAPASPILNAHIVSNEDLRRGERIRTRGPVIATPRESEDFAVAGASELFDSWYTPDFTLGDWVHEHTKREVRERWSMDI